MALADDVYLPNLEKCFFGQALTISWTQVFKELFRHGDNYASERNFAFLSSDPACRILSQPVPTFPKSSSQSINEFEAKTSAINVTPSAQAQYNIGEIKQDALWLSKEVDLDEIEALRIAMIEWQGRPSVQLREGLSEAESASLQDALGPGDHRNGTVIRRVLTRDKDTEISFSSEVKRRTRLVALWNAERANVVGVSRILLEIVLQNSESLEQGTTNSSHSRRQKYRSEGLKELAHSLMPRDYSRTHDGAKQVQSCMTALKGSLENGILPLGMESDTSQLQRRGSFEGVIFILELVLLNVRALPGFLDSEIILSWLQLSAAFNFGLGLEVEWPEHVDLCERVQSLTSIITVAVLNPAAAVANIFDDSTRSDPHANYTISNSPYFYQDGNVTEVHKIIFPWADACIIPASPASLAWGIILFTIRNIASATKDRREALHVQKAIDHSSGFDHATGRRLSSSSVSSIQQSVFEDIVDAVRNESHTEDDTEILLQSALDGSRVFDYITHLCNTDSSAWSLVTAFKADTLRELVSISIDPVTYTPDIVTAQLAILSMPLSKGDNPRGQQKPFPDPRDSFMDDQMAISGIFDVAAARFPYEMVPFLRLCSALISADRFNEHGMNVMGAALKDLATFTQVATLAFSAYHTVREDLNANLVSLEKTVSMFDGLEQKLLEYGGQISELAYAIPTGTIGEVISDGRPPVIRWEHHYSGLGYLGFWLDNYRSGRTRKLISDFVDADAAAAAAMELLANLLSSEGKNNSTEGNAIHDTGNALALIEDFGSGLAADIDMVTIIFEVLEQQLQGLRHRKFDQESCQLLVACLKLVNALLPVLPGRTWSALSRSSLMEFHGSLGAVLPIIVSIESAQEEYEFFEAYILLYRGLIEDSIRQAVKLDQPAAAGRLEIHALTNAGGVPTHVANDILLVFTRHMIEIFQLSTGWTFRLGIQRYRLCRDLSSAFETVLLYAYGADDSPKLSTKLTAGLASSAEYIVDALRPTQSDALSIASSLHWLLIAWEDSGEDGNEHTFFIRSGQVQATITLITTLVRVGRLLEQSQSALETQILNMLPVLVRLLSLHWDCSAEILTLMQSLLEVVSAEQAPSFLSHLGSVSSKNLLELVNGFIRQGESDRIVVIAWNFLAALVSNGQQWFAVVLLTGSTPGRITGSTLDASETQNELVLRGKPMLIEALDKLSEIGNLEVERAQAILGFLVKSQIHWSWATESLHKYTTILPALMAFVIGTTMEPSDQLAQCCSNKVASLVVELATVYLHYARSNRDISMIQKLIPMMQWLTTNAVEVSGYNSSLHTNLRKNFSARYTGCSLASFKRTLLVDKPYGKTYFYDIDLATKMLSQGKLQNKRPGFDQSFQQELVRANLNLSLVDSQLALLESFQNFCVEHSAFFVQEREVQKMMAHVVQNCLIANTRACPSEKIFDSLFQSRADFALALIQRLVEVKPKGSDFIVLLGAAWDALRFGNGTYESAIANDDLVYFRSLLSIVLFAMQFHIHRKPKSKPPEKAALLTMQPHTSSSTVLEIASTLIAEGMKSVVSTVRDQASNQAAAGDVSVRSSVDVKDVSLLLTLFHAILRHPDLTQIVSQLSGYFISANTMQSCLLLYSWSHALTSPETNNEPVYAEMSIRFLVSLSSLPPLAEELAVEGILSRISTCRLTQVLRSAKKGVSPLDQRLFHSALYGVWTTGILPLCLNLLHSVGRAMAGEVAAFLNQFPLQLSRAATCFAAYTGIRAESAEPLTLALANEAATLALISRILASYRAAGASAGVDAIEVVALEGYDDQKTSLGEDIEETLVGGRKARLRVKFVAMSEKELAMQMSEGGDKLEEAIIADLRNALLCLKGTEEHADMC